MNHKQSKKKLPSIAVAETAETVITAHQPTWSKANIKIREITKRNYLTHQITNKNIHLFKKYQQMAIKFTNFHHKEPTKNHTKYQKIPPQKSNLNQLQEIFPATIVNTIIKKLNPKRPQSVSIHASNLQNQK